MFYNKTLYATSVDIWLINVYMFNICDEYAKAHEELDDTSLLCYFRAYEMASCELFGKLKIPHDNFVYYVASMEVLSK